MQKQPCRNFQRGSCRYGDRCKFLHAIPQQQQSNNNNSATAFGFGSQNQNQQQQNPRNPFGFGVQSNHPSKPSNDFANNQQPQFKPFENKWTRPSNTAPSSRQPANQRQQPANQQQPPNHRCTDPDACKRMIADDFENERPLWNLTCYGHWRNVPCDIVGDISYEELRAVAYDDAKRGLSLPSIVERERNLLNSKLVEFENLLRNPYKGPSNAAVTSQSQIPATTNALSRTAQNSGPPLVSSFSQLGSSLNSDPRVSPSPPSYNVFGQTNSNLNPSQISGLFGNQVANQTFSSSQVVNQPFGSQVANQPFGSQVANQPFGSQVANQPFGSSFTPNLAGFSNIGANNSSNHFSTNTFSSSGQSQTLSSASVFSPSPLGQTTTNNIEISQKGAVPVNAEIWLKEKWAIGEIPEEAPPEEYC